MTVLRTNVHERDDEFVIVRLRGYTNGRWQEARVTGRFPKAAWRDVYRFLDDWGFPSCDQCGTTNRDML